MVYCLNGRTLGCCSACDMSRFRWCRRARERAPHHTTVRGYEEDKNSSLKHHWVGFHVCDRMLAESLESRRISAVVWWTKPCDTPFRKNVCCKYLHVSDTPQIQSHLPQYFIHHRAGHESYGECLPQPQVIFPLQLVFYLQLIH